MGFLRRLFSTGATESLPNDLDGLLTELEAQRARITGAERIANLNRGLLESAVRERHGVTFADASGPRLVMAILSAEDARLLARSGLGRFRSEVNGRVQTIEGALFTQAHAEPKNTVNHLLKIMATTGSDSEALRATCGYFLIEKLGASAIGEVEAALTDSDANIRFQAAHVLRFLKSDRAVDLLIDALTDQDGDVRAMAAQALAWQGNAKALPALLGVAEKDESSGVRQQAKAAADALQRAVYFQMQPVRPV